MVAAAAAGAGVLGAERRSNEPPGAGGPPRTARPTGPITARGLAEHLEALQRIAAEHGGNRAAGTPGDRATAAYVEQRLREAGYGVTVGRFGVPFFSETSAPRLTAGERSFEPGRDHRTMRFSGPGTATGAVRRLGLGCSAGELAGLREGDVALVQRGTCTFRRKAVAAERAGAAALLVADRGEPVQGSLGRPGVRIPVLAVGSEAAAALDGATATVELDVVSEQRTTRNVVGEIGSGRVVMAGGHLDSVPAGPGLNDNGSGVAALLEIAEQLAGRRPGGAVRLGFWGAEEIGLVGSRRYVDGLPADARRRIAAYVNLDMVGSPDAEPAVYDGAAVRGRARRGSIRIEAVLRRHVGRGAEETDLGASTDHVSFARAGIPVGGLFTGLDDCYHQRCDTLRNVDRAVLTESARAASAALLELSR